MAKNRVRKKATRRRSSKTGSSSGRLKPELTKDEMLDRVPDGEDKELLTTADVQHIFNDCHQQTIYKMIGRGELNPFKSRNRGKANVYKRDEVIAAIVTRFQLTPGRRPSGDHSGRGSSSGAVSGPTGRKAKKEKGC